MTDEPRNNASKPRGRPFERGNPGRPKGARHRMLAERLMQDDAEAIIRAVIDSAKSGELQAARIVLDRIVPPRKLQSFPPSPAARSAPARPLKSPN